MGVQDQRHIAHGVLDALDEVLGLVGAHGAGHVLEADGIKAHGLQLFAHFHVLFYGVDRALGVGDTAGGHGVGRGVLLGGFQSGLDVAEVVEGVKNTDNVDTVLNGQLHELFHHIVMIMLVAQQVLTTQQHLQLGVGQVLSQTAQTLPGIFAQIAQAGIEGGTAPAFHGVVAGLIHGAENAFIIAVRQTSGHKGLVGVPKHGLGNLHFSCHDWKLLFYDKQIPFFVHTGWTRQKGTPAGQTCWRFKIVLYLIDMLCSD